MQANEVRTDPKPEDRGCTHSEGVAGASVQEVETDRDGNCFFHAVNKTLESREEPPLDRQELVDWMRENLSHDLAHHDFGGRLRKYEGNVEDLDPFLDPKLRRYTDHGRSLGDLIIFAIMNEHVDGPAIPDEQGAINERLHQYLELMRMETKWAGKPSHVPLTALSPWCRCLSRAAIIRPPTAWSAAGCGFFAQVFPRQLPPP